MPPRLQPRTIQEALTPRSVTLKASDAQTASSQTGAIEIYGKELTVTLDVTAVSGTTPTLDVKLQHSPDGSLWSDLGTAFTQKTAVSREVKTFTQMHGYVRVVWTIGGTTPSFTCSVEATERP